MSLESQENEDEAPGEDSPNIVFEMMWSWMEWVAVKTLGETRSLEEWFDDHGFSDMH